MNPIEVLSESPIGPVALDTLYHMITEGDCSGHVKTLEQQGLDGKQAAKALLRQASDPSFFNPTDEGETCTQMKSITFTVDMQADCPDRMPAKKATAPHLAEIQVSACRPTNLSGPG
jgi:hypothetical protein